MIEVSIRFDAEAARVRAANRGWTYQEWARQANVSEKTLRAFLDGDPRQRLITVERIVQALGGGMVAADLVKVRKIPISETPAGTPEKVNQP